MFYLSYREYGLSKMVSSHLFYRVRWIIPERLGKLKGKGDMHETLHETG